MPHACACPLCPRLLAFVRDYVTPATDLVAQLAALDAEADSILREADQP